MESKFIIAISIIITIIITIINLFFYYIFYFILCQRLLIIINFFSIPAPPLSVVPSIPLPPKLQPHHPARPRPTLLYPNQSQPRLAMPRRDPVLRTPSVLL